jgi:hypothetical protein
VCKAAVPLERYGRDGKISNGLETFVLRGVVDDDDRESRTPAQMLDASPQFFATLVGDDNDVDLDFRRGFLDLTARIALSQHNERV